MAPPKPPAKPVKPPAVAVPSSAPPPVPPKKPAPAPAAAAPSGAAPSGGLVLELETPAAPSEPKSPSAVVRTVSASHPNGVLRWVKGALLGRGAQGKVYKAQNLDDGTMMAVKEVELMEGAEDDIKALRREIKLMEGLDHPNVVKFFGSEVSEGHIYIFLELLSGGSLTSVVKKFGVLDEPLAADYIRQALLGLQYLHGRGIIHRDVKGENMLLDGQGNIKISDFGMSKQTDADKDGCSSLVGTPFFMAPEMVRGEDYGAKADVWSTGCTLLEILTGKPPWVGEMGNSSSFQILYKIGNGKKPPKYPESISDDCRGFLDCCFVRDPALRSGIPALLEHPFLINLTRE